MKLLVKTTIFYLLITLAVFGIGGVMTYGIIKKQVDLELDRHLRHKLRQTIKAIERGMPATSIFEDNLIIEKLEGTHYDEERPQMVDTLVWHIYLKRMEPNRKATVTKQINSQYFRLSIYDVIVEDQDIYDSVVQALTRLYVLLALALVIFGVLFSKRLFMPFEQTLKKIKSFRLQDPKPLHFSKAHTREFSNLNTFIAQMTSKAQQDYINLKEFTENASHEMQTPLAIAKGKLELLLEKENPDEEEVRLIASAYNAITKLSRMGKSLALLSKIENHEFSDKKEINLSQIADNSLFNFKELIELKSLGLKTDLAKDVKLNMDPVLADILLTNVLQNAVRHNLEGGIIEVYLDQRILSIKNTGNPPEFPTDQLFERFKKSNQSAASNGLGLAIVKKICEVNRFSIDYHYHENWHEVTVMF